MRNKDLAKKGQIMIGEEEIATLLRADSRLPEYMAGPSSLSNYAAIVSTALQTGLHYVAKNTMDQSVLPIEKIGIEDGQTILRTKNKNFESEDFIVGSDRFYEEALADNYVGGVCGCFVHSMEDFKRLEALLPHGSVYYSILTEGCGEPFRERAERIGFEGSELEKIQEGIFTTGIGARYAADNNLPAGLADRLHVLTSNYTYHPSNPKREM